MAAPHREQKGSAELCFLVTVIWEVEAWSCVRGGSGWVLGKGFSPEGSGYGTGCPGQSALLQAAGVQERSGQHSQTWGLDFGLTFCYSMIL